MRLGLYLRNMGQASARETVRECALGAEALGIDDLWLADHIAIPPDDAEGSQDTRYEIAQQNRGHDPVELLPSRVVT